MTTEWEAAKEDAARQKTEWAEKLKKCQDEKDKVEGELERTKRKFDDFRSEEQQPNKKTAEEMSKLQLDNATLKCQLDFYVKQTDMLMQRFAVPPPPPLLPFQDLSNNRFQFQMTPLNQKSESATDTASGFAAQSVSIYGSASPSPMTYYVSNNPHGNTFVHQQQQKPPL